MTHTPIDTYGFLSDSHTTALVGPDGSVDWLCVPQADGPSLFARILDAGRGGSWQVDVVDGRVTGRRYLPGTFVLVTTWEAPEGVAEVVDLLDVRQTDDPDELDAGHLLLRLVRVVRGRARVRCRVDARPDYARQRPRWQQDDGTWTEEVSGVRLLSDVPLAAEDGLLTATAELEAGESATWGLAYLPDALDTDCLGRGEELAERTAASWRRWGERARYDGPAHEAVLRSALVLRALSFDETGALMAAPTTSLPEEIGGERNWDYRYTWHRDASLHVMALHLLGHVGLGRSYGEFLVDRCVRGVERLRPMAGLRGEQSGAEGELEHLDGYSGSRPVRIGNEAFEQVQHSTHGFVLDTALIHLRVAGGLPPGHWEAMRDVVDSACRQWREPDAHMWEMRGEPQHYTHSKLMNWVAIDRGIQLAEELDDGEAPLDVWRRNRDEVRADILEHGWNHELGAFTLAYGGTALDASLLRIALLGFLPGDDARVVGTIDRVAEGLGAGPALIHRYDTDEVDDGVTGGEGAFLLSSFEMVSALVLAGRASEARRRFDWLVDRCGPLGLYAEQMDPDGHALGNYPQAFSHLGLIEAAVALRWSDDDDVLRAWTLRQPEAFEERW
ncbi:glycoside hydrolase family 15 protein [Isoptericola halotolerans]|uniref:GH15 family glucan-1,4-alpha-glucosidase n=1 Tax=Isoptericola halotolerans TaxID=300560 RepID=A0ABX2A087_9MICO|nr:GH15 family glucan-1,4-alpha-glucosidase [Isoptericola halotolerans]